MEYLILFNNTHKMNEIYYRIIDALHGVLIVLLLYYVCRLLIIRKEGSLRIRYIAGIFLLCSCIQTVICFLLEENNLINVTKGELISVWMDLLAGIMGLLMAMILIRNRHRYHKQFVYIGCALLLIQFLCYIVCVIFQFADWTYLFYLPLSAILWGAFGYTIDTATLKEPVKLLTEKKEESAFMIQLNKVLREDNLFCQEDLNRDAICRLMLTNRTTFSQNLKESTGKTFSEFLREMRLEEAARLLRETDMPIDQIAYEVGLRSTSGFYRNFLLSYGTTPNQYRKNNRKTID